MNCPQCGGSLSPWAWEDGGYKGVRCDGCDQKWWSDSFGTKAYEAEKAAVATLIGNLKFPDDAVTDDDWRKQIELERRKEGHGES